MRGLYDKIGETENDIVHDALTGILSHRIRFFSKGDKEQALEDVEKFIETYPHREERRETHFICRLAYQALINSGVIAEVIRQREKIGI